MTALAINIPVQRFRRRDAAAKWTAFREIGNIFREILLNLARFAYIFSVCFRIFR